MDALAPWNPEIRTLPVTPDRITEICRSAPTNGSS
jgi:hypothetical protein